MTAAFAAIRFASWQEAYSCGMQLTNWFFRGQSDCAWELECALARAIGVRRGDPFRCNHSEKWMLRKFMGAAHQYLAHLPEDDNLLEWVALMQHHGAPTRLLDCTYSFPVAVFFAARDAKTDFAIWGFNWGRFMKSLTARFNLDEDVQKDALKFHNEMHLKANAFLRAEASGALVFPVEPPRQNERIAAQQGLFLFPCDLTRTFLENVQCLFMGADLKILRDPTRVASYDATDHNAARINRLTVVKFILPAKERFCTLADLQRMNIHDASLFPGLDGFARSLSRYARFDEPPGSAS